MPTRYLKPGIRDSEIINDLSPMAEILFYRLLVTVDDFGRYDARPAMIKSGCFPIKETLTVSDCEDLLKELSDNDAIHVYTHNGKPYLQIVRWDNIPRASSSKFPEYSDDCETLYKTDYNCIQMHTDAPLTETVTKTDINTLSPASAVDDCPHNSIVDLYHELLPMLTTVRVWTDKRKRLLKARWREDSKRQNLEWWGRYFRYVAGSDFLTGKASDWQADLEWLLNASNLVKVIEGKYQNKGAE